MNVRSRESHARNTEREAGPVFTLFLFQSSNPGYEVGSNRDKFANMAVSTQRHQLSDHVLFEHSDKELHGIVLPDSRITAEAHVSTMEKYRQMYQRSIEDPECFWREVAEQFHWHKPPTTFLSYNFNVESGPIFIKWMEGAQTNICYNVLDRIIKEKNGEDTIAFYWLVCINACLALCKHT